MAPVTTEPGTLPARSAQRRGAATGPIDRLPPTGASAESSESFDLIAHGPARRRHARRFRFVPVAAPRAAARSGRFVSSRRERRPAGRQRRFIIRNRQEQE
ncbi:hypothetical protein [Burkholderia perseverans]|uniref:hypothetical protein n=1 Tax=Burkholderia perseverans TaxID=2615214 RepID=UPI001FEDAC86|nr:hypothetical protein [Burkholderia perseverans]